MTAWYDTQIIGVIIGALIVFGGTEAGKIIQSMREKRRLKAGIISEVSVVLRFLADALEAVKKWENELKTSDIVRRWKMGSFGRTHFIDTHFNKLGILKREFIPKVIEFRSLIESLPGGYDLLQESIDSYNSGMAVNKELVVANVGGMRSGIEDLIRIGKEIIQNK